MNRLSTTLMTTGAAVAVILSGPGATAAEAAPQHVEIFTQYPGEAIGARAVNEQVNLGDSYAAGFGGDVDPHKPTDLKQFQPNTILPGVNECHRLSADNYAGLVATAMGNTLVDVACAGATTEDILSKTQWEGDERLGTHQPPQIRSVTKDTHLVTLQVGGNDAKFAEVLKDVVGDITDPQNPDKQLEETSESYVEATRILDDELPGRFDNVLSEIKRRAANDVKIIFNSYDNILPQSMVQPNLCSPYMTENELALSRIFLQKLNNDARDAAERAGDQVEFVEPKEWSREYDAVGLPEDACSPSAAAKAWSIRFEDFDPNSPNVSFHGNKGWHWARARAILQQLGQ